MECILPMTPPALGLGLVPDRDWWVRVFSSYMAPRGVTVANTARMAAVEELEASWACRR
jgi:hypothetical protein